jgi:GxxExxY protein
MMSNRTTIPPDIDELARISVDAAFCIHRELGPGLLESAYEGCFAQELMLRGIHFHRQVRVPLHYKGMAIETGFRADVIVEEKLLVELKAVDSLVPVNKAQVITYLKILKLPLGLLINFNEPLIKDGIQRVLNFQKT